MEEKREGVREGSQFTDKAFWDPGVQFENPVNSCLAEKRKMVAFHRVIHPLNKV